MRGIKPRTISYWFTFLSAHTDNHLRTPTSGQVTNPCLAANNKLNLNQNFTSLPDTDDDPGVTQVFYRGRWGSHGPNDLLTNCVSLAEQ